ncbi:MAG TPA: hypothetical protein VFV05_09555 [Methylomirabilota bacterium]|nr:hypothetical protein [Methylomirabilota bacterium]
MTRAGDGSAAEETEVYDCTGALVRVESGDARRGAPGWPALYAWLRSVHGWREARP